MLSLTLLRLFPSAPHQVPLQPVSSCHILRRSIFPSLLAQHKAGKELQILILLTVLPVVCRCASRLLLRHSDRELVTVAFTHTKPYLAQLVE